jgi:hypothetical protein
MNAPAPTPSPQEINPVTSSSNASEGLPGQSQKAGQEHAQTDHHKTQGLSGLLHQSHAAGQEPGAEQLLAGKLPNESWVEFILRMGRGPGGNNGGGGNDQGGYERGRQRSLSDEEKKDQSRGS